jgi:hypothetical protein
VPEPSYWYLGVSPISVPYWSEVTMCEVEVGGERVVAPMLFTERETADSERSFSRRDGSSDEDCSSRNREARPLARGPVGRARTRSLRPCFGSAARQPASCSASHFPSMAATPPAERPTKENHDHDEPS